jgi:HPr kinase/phosphorylase
VPRHRHHQHRRDVRHQSVRLEKRIDLVVSLREWTPDAVEERTGLEENYYEILGIKVPHIELFVRPGRDIARLVEVAALVQALKRMGHDPPRISTTA